MPITYCVAKTESYGKLNNVVLNELKVPTGIKSRYYFFRDGNYLALKVTNRRHECTRIWYVLTMQRYERGTTVKYREHRHPIGCLSDTTLDTARQICSKVISHIRATNKLPLSLKTLKLTPTIYRDDGSTYTLNSLYSVRKAKELTEADIFKLHAYNRKKGRIFSVCYGLAVFVKEKLDHTYRHYVYRYETPVGTYRQKIASCLSIPYFLAKDITTELNKHISQIPYEQRSVYISTVIESKIAEYKSKSTTTIKPTQSAPAIFLSNDAIQTIFEKCTEIFPFQSLRDAAGKNSALTFGELLKAWLNWWSNTVSDNTVRNAKYTLLRYTSCIINQNVCDLINHGTLQSYLLNLYYVSPKIGYSVFKMVRRVIDFAVILQAVKYNPLYALKLLIKKPQSEHHKTLDPLNLSSAIKSFFENHGSILPTRSRIFVELLFCTLLRPGELAKIMTSNIRDTELYDGKILHLPRTKNKKPFNVPLTPYAYKLIKLWQEISQHESIYLFPNTKNPKKHLKAGVISNHLLNVGCFYLHLHGIRACGASFFALHCKEIPYEVGMACLHHAYTTYSHQCYDHTELFVPRIDAMRVWCDYLQKNIGKHSVLTYAGPLIN